MTISVYRNVPNQAWFKVGGQVAVTSEGETSASNNLQPEGPQEPLVSQEPTNFTRALAWAQRRPEWAQHFQWLLSTYASINMADQEEVTIYTFIRMLELYNLAPPGLPKLFPESDDHGFE